jgi:myo-inositol 2-dehydrogenase/D-chiro-inositol 1-dehydrogenase
LATTNDCIKVGLIGCGQAAIRGHLPALRYVKDAQLVAVADVDPARLERAANEFGVPRRYVTPSDLLNDSDVDVVGVCVPTELHLQVASAVLDAGKHLLLEKPLALSLGECDQLIDRARRASTMTMMGFNLRWHRLARQARDMVRRGKLGQVRMVHIVSAGHHHSEGALPEWRKRREWGGGGLVDAGVHDFDLWRFLLDAEVEEVLAMTRSDVVDDEVASIVARMTNGVLISTSIVEHVSSTHRFEILGLGGRLQASCFRFDGMHFVSIAHRPGDLPVRLGSIASTLRELPRALLRPGGMNDYSGSFVSEWQHFIDCVRSGTRPTCTFVDGKRALKVAFAATRSASLGQAVRVAEAPDTPHPASER